MDARCCGHIYERLLQNHIVFMGVHTIYGDYRADHNVWTQSLTTCSVPKGILGISLQIRILLTVTALVTQGDTLWWCDTVTDLFTASLIGQEIYRKSHPTWCWFSGYFIWHKFPYTIRVQKVNLLGRTFIKRTDLWGMTASISSFTSQFTPYWILTMTLLPVYAYFYIHICWPPGQPTFWWVRYTDGTVKLRYRPQEVRSYTYSDISCQDLKTISGHVYIWSSFPF